MFRDSGEESKVPFPSRFAKFGRFIVAGQY